MLFVSVGQGWIFLILVITGIWCAVLELLLAKLFKFIKKNAKNKQKIEKNTQKSIKFTENQKNKKRRNKNLNNFLIGIIYFSRILIYFGLIYLLVYFLDYGNLRIYHILGFCVGFYLIKYFFVRLIQNRLQKCYNHTAGVKEDGNFAK